MTMVTFDRERAVRLFRDYVRKFEDGVEPFNRLRLPEHEFLPTWIKHGSREHRLFLFFASWLSRRGNKASEVYKIAAWHITHEPWLIDPAHPRSLDLANDTHLRSILPRGNNTRFGDPVAWWLEALAILRQEYGSDPINLFQNLPVDQGWRVAKDELVKRHLRFKGIGPKITALNVGQFQKEILLFYTPYWQFVRTLPVFTADIHVMRLFRMHGIITEWEDDKAKKVSEVISEFVSGLCAEEGIPHISLFQAMWLIGAKSCDTMRRRKKNARAFCHQHCPAVEHCLGVVPPNFIPAGKNGEPRQWLASLRYAELVPHPDLVELPTR